MGRIFDLVVAALALAAAVFWFLSAYGELPHMGSYWDSTPVSDPFYKAVKFSATMNKWASVLSGLSALVMAIKLFLGF